MDYSVLKKRYIGLDLLRILSAFMICAFHTQIHLGCNYYLFQSVVQMGAVYMTAFFMLSGFSLFVNHAGDNLNDKKNLSNFWIKRVIGIIPMYYFSTMLYIIFIGKESLGQNLVLIPIEMFGLQSTIFSLSTITHNGGTWFISCICICYFAYPFFQEILKQITVKTKTFILVFCAALLLYTPILVYKMNLESTYANPFFRFIEFYIGMLLASFRADFPERASRRQVLRWITVIVVFIIMNIGITMSVHKGLFVGNYIMYNWICLPCFAVILFVISGVKSDFIERSKLIKSMNDMTYVFFLSQLFSNFISKKLISNFDVTRNIIKIAIGWGVCLGIAFLFRIVEKNVKPRLLSRFYKT